MENVQHHYLKIKLAYAIAFLEGKKNWEIRKNDRNFKVNDIVVFTITETGYVYRGIIDYVFEGGVYGLDKEYCIFSLSKCDSYLKF